MNPDTSDESNEADRRSVVTQQFRVNDAVVSGCPLCEAEVNVWIPFSTEYYPEGDNRDYLGLKRALSDEHGLSVSVTEVKNHIDGHVGFSFGVQQ